MEVPKKGVSCFKQKLVLLLFGKRLLISDNHRLYCPRCKSKMRKIEKEDVHIDVCPYCQGMWLDDGEIDRIAQTVMQNNKVTITKKPSNKTETIKKITKQQQ